MNAGVKLALTAFGLWALYEVLRTAATAAPASLPTSVPGTSTPVLPAGTLTITAPAPLPGASAPSMLDLQAAGDFWGTLTPVNPPGTGYINFPSGSQAAAATFRYGTMAQDPAGNLYVQWAGEVYEVTGPDAQGNWPATLVH